MPGRRARLEREVDVNPLRAVEEEAHRLLRRCLHKHQARVGARETIDLEALFPCHGERYARRRQHRDVGRDAEQLLHQTGAAREMLAVVENDQ